MPADVIAMATRASGDANEDRVGASGALAWVIDGATDVIETPLTQSPSDAAWFAEEMHKTLRAIAAEPAIEFETLAAKIPAVIAPRFAKAARRAPATADEQPSAAAMIVRVAGDTLDYLALGDCTLMIETEGRLIHIGEKEEEAGDQWVRDALKSTTAAAPPGVQPPAPDRATLWPKLRLARRRMNTPDGYGIFSITEPPAHFVKSGTLRLATGARILIASDGIMRLSDVFRHMSRRSVFEAAWSHGLDHLIDTVRAIETADADCRRYPRAKTSDDATGLLLRIT